jgi:hypothetical protein
VTSDYGALSIPPQKKNIEYGEVRWYVLMVPKEMGLWNSYGATFHPITCP